jgi:uncharacterized membrane protein
MSTQANYISLETAALMRKQAIRVWMAGLFLVLIWVLLIIGLPIAKANGFEAIISPLYHLFSFICHQIPERSFHLLGEPFAVCSRCFGVYFGLLFGFAVYPIWRDIAEIEPLPRFWLFLSLVPMSIDWSLTFFGIWENTHLSRFITGIVVGVACATFIVPALVEIIRNFTKRRRQAF